MKKAKEERERIAMGSPQIAKAEEPQQPVSGQTDQPKYAAEEKTELETQPQHEQQRESSRIEEV
jgi:hypothetical protein